MTLIAILGALISESFWKALPVLRHFEGLIRFAVWLQARFKDKAWFNGPVGVLCVIVPGVFLVGLVQSSLGTAEGFLAWLLSLIFAIAMLIFCIGVKDLVQYTKQYLDAWEKNDSAAAFTHVKELIGQDVPDNIQQLHKRFLEIILIRTNERLLAILFWFVVLGPVGAMLYRSASQLKSLARDEYQTDEYFLGSALQLKAILDWVPIRITALCYAVIGSFVDAMHNWNASATIQHHDLMSANYNLLVATGLGSLQITEIDAEEELDHELVNEQVEAAQALVKRTVVAWLTILALLTIVGWLV